MTPAEFRDMSARYSLLLEEADSHASKIVETRRAMEQSAERKTQCEKEAAQLRRQLIDYLKPPEKK